MQSKHNFEFGCNSPIIDDNICIVMIINITIVEIVRNVYCDTIDREYEYNISILIIQLMIM